MMMDSKSGYIYHQDRRRRRKEDRGDDTNLDDRLADGFDLLSEDDPKDPLPPQVSDVDAQEIP